MRRCESCVCVCMYVFVCVCVYVCMYKHSNHKKKGWVQKNLCFWIVVLEKTLVSPLDCKEIRPVNPKGNQPWMFIGRTDAEAPIPWPPDTKSWVMRKDPDTGKDWRQEKKRMRWLHCITDSMDPSLSKLREIAKYTEGQGSLHAAVYVVAELDIT